MFACEHLTVEAWWVPKACGLPLEVWGEAWASSLEQGCGGMPVACGSLLEACASLLVQAWGWLPEAWGSLLGRACGWLPEAGDQAWASSMELPA